MYFSFVTQNFLSKQINKRLAIIESYFDKKEKKWLLSFPSLKHPLLSLIIEWKYQSALFMFVFMLLK